LIQKESRRSAHIYVVRCSEPGVGDFDSRSVPADVTYCPKSDFESPEAPVSRFDSKSHVGFLWHSACSFWSKRLNKTASDNKKKSENTPPQQASKRPMSPAKAGLLFSRADCNPD
jgi:hypothetical protein